MEQIHHFLHTPFLSFLFYLLQYTQIQHNRMRSRCKQCSGSSICASTTAKEASESSTGGRASASTTAGASSRASNLRVEHQREREREREREHCLIKVFFHSRVFKYKFLSPATSLPLSEQTISSPTCGLACASIYTFYSLQVHYECQSLVYTASESVTTSLFSGTS